MGLGKYETKRMKKEYRGVLGFGLEKLKDKNGEIKRIWAQGIDTNDMSLVQDNTHTNINNNINTKIITITTIIIIIIH